MHNTVLRITVLHYSCAVQDLAVCYNIKILVNKNIITYILITALCCAVLSSALDLTSAAIGLATDTGIVYTYIV